MKSDKQYFNKKRRLNVEQRHDKVKRLKQGKKFNFEFRQGEESKAKKLEDEFYKDGKKIITLGINYVHYLEVLNQIAQEAALNYGSEIEAEILTGKRSEITKSIDYPEDQLEELIGPYPTIKWYKENKRDNTNNNQAGGRRRGANAANQVNLNEPLTEEEKEELEMLQEEYKSKKKRWDNEWAAKRAIYQENYGKCIESILQRTSANIQNDLKTKTTGYLQAKNSQSVAVFFDWFKDKVKAAINMGGDREDDQIAKLIGTDTDHLKIRDCEDEMAYIMNIERLIDEYHKIKLNKKWEDQQDEVAEMTIAERKEAKKRLSKLVRKEIEENSMIKRVIFRELRDFGGGKRSEAVKEAIKSKTIDKKIMVGDVPYSTVSEMLEDLKPVVRNAKLENAEKSQQYHTVRNGWEKDGKVIVNSQGMRNQNGQKKDCWYCKKKLNREDQAKGHTWDYCWYNRDSSQYKGKEEEERALKKAKARAETDKKEIKNYNAVMKEMKILKDTVEKLRENNKDKDSEKKGRRRSGSEDSD